LVLNWRAQAKTLPAGNVHPILYLYNLLPEDTYMHQEKKGKSIFEGKGNKLVLTVKNSCHYSIIYGKYASSLSISYGKPYSTLLKAQDYEVLKYEPLFAYFNYSLS